MRSSPPHADQDGPCGYEIKNRGFTGFVRGEWPVVLGGGGRRNEPHDRHRQRPGCALADQIEALAREDLAVIPDLPEGEGGDWNDVLGAGPRLR
jgi:hypothetical protein